MAAPSFVRRGMLYIPASSSKMLAKSLGLTVDCAAFDLEDSVAPDQKYNARTQIAQFLQQERPQKIKELAVRINATDTKHALADLNAVLNTPNLDTIVVPKVQAPSDLTFVSDVIRHIWQKNRPAQEGNELPLPKIIALIETAKGLVNLNDICKASPLLSGLGFAAEDFCLDLSITRTPSLSELLFARSSIVTAARAHQIPSAMDLVTTAFKGEDGLQTLRHECADGKRMGFNGKQLIHPGQVEVAQKEFGPDDEELEWAARIVAADAKADSQGKGAWKLDGKMIDVPVVKRARALLSRAEVCDVDVTAIMEKWNHQEPE